MISNLNVNNELGKFFSLFQQRSFESFLFLDLSIVIRDLFLLFSILQKIFYIAFDLPCLIIFDTIEKQDD